MSHPLSAYGCIICASPAVVATITVERNGVLAHYPTCGEHIMQACRRVVSDSPALFGQGTGPATGDMIAHHTVGARDVTPTPDRLRAAVDAADRGTPVPSLDTIRAIEAREVEN